jgi:methyl-accepting chemotaxis protein
MGIMKSSLKKQILLTAGSLFLVIIVVILAFAGVVSYRNAGQLAEAEANRIAIENGALVKYELERAVETGKTLANALAANPKDKQMVREVSYQIIANVNRNNKSYQGVYSYFEPETFDLLEPTVEPEPFQSWWYWEDGKQIRYGIEPYEEDWGGEDWYTLCKESKKSELIEPYWELDLKLPIVSISTPILRDNSFVGMVGIDMEIDYVQELTDNIRIYDGKGKIAIFSNKGSVCGFTGGVDPVGEGDDVRMPFITEKFGVGDSALKHIEEGKSFTFENNKNIAFVLPLDISQGTSMWAVMVEVPRSVVFAKARTTLWTLIFIGIGATIIALLILSSLISRLIKPLERVVSQCENISEGNLSEDMTREDVDRVDEVGKLAKSFQGLIDSLREKVKVAKQIAAGELDFKVHPSSNRDELGMALEDMKDSLTQMVTTIGSTATKLELGSANISSAGIALSEGATETAASVEEISSTLNSIEGHINESSKNAEEVSVKTVGASKDAEKCNGQMQDLKTAMSDIAEGTKNISKIIKTIDDIAFQTNLLALNAAVEAARAGQHGKGFAVVADEVRNLANRSAKAAKETGDLISNGLARVADGEKLTQYTADALGSIVESTKEVSVLISEINVASTEQATSISQISDGLEQIATATQNTTAHAEETASAIQELESEASQLSHLVSRFHIAKDIEGEYHSSVAVEDKRSPINLLDY